MHRTSRQTLSSIAASTLNGAPEEESGYKRDARFWLIFVALCCCTLLSALDLGGIGTAGPTIVHDLNGGDFTWVASAYALAASMFIPLSGNLSQIFGRQPIILGGIVVFAVGSAVCASAHAMAVLIFGRAIQGVGSGTIQALTSIIVTDLVPLRERGVYSGVTGMIWTVGSVAGPFLAGGLAQKSTWRWLFYINLPLCGLAFGVVAVFLRLKKPEGNLREKILMVDWLGNLLIMASTCSTMLALTWGGIRFSWGSPNILVPLILGVLGMGCTLFYESKWPAHPVIPLMVFSNRTSIAGYITIFLQGMLTLGLACEPTWFQSVRLATPLMSGVLFLPLTATISFWGIVQGLVISKTGLYRPLTFAGWALILLGSGLFISLQVNSSVGLVIFYQFIFGAGIGFLHSTTFPVLAPLPLSANGPAMALVVFLRQFSQAWGVAIWGTILQNALQKKLPVDAIFAQDSVLTNGQQLAYAVIPLIPTMPETLRSEVQGAFLEGFRDIWIAFAVCAAVGLISCSAMKNYPLKRAIDGRWGIDRSEKKTTMENSRESPA
ncbi:MFS general substrate transporter [Pholiota conissans]|uniref:MFS general substrate transporter n=1 Tax=Pholiota conissans TaxID=109636 RepID=A0A9P6CRI0_9AGAR|nr:MFS general substrate transporter [Pholiota conissans]